MIFFIIIKGNYFLTEKVRQDFLDMQNVLFVKQNNRLFQVIQHDAHGVQEVLSNLHSTLTI